MNTNNTDMITDNIIKTHLEEYKVLRNELLQRSEFQEKLAGYTFLLVGGLLTFIGMKDKLSNFDILILFTPLFFYALGWIYAINDYNIIRIAKYINTDLKKKLQTLLNDTTVLGWENYHIRERENFKGLSGFLSNSSQILFPIFIPIIIVLYFFHCKNWCIGEIKHEEMWLLCINIIVCIATIIIKTKAWNDYKSIAG
jgi:hypothetical protein